MLGRLWDEAPPCLSQVGLLARVALGDSVASASLWHLYLSCVLSLLPSEFC